MPRPPKLEKAELQEIYWTEQQQVRDGDKSRTVKVQFNPETLTVAFANQSTGGDQRGGGAVQFVGRGTTKLNLELWFDVSAPLADGQTEPTGDVRKLTEKVAFFIKPKPAQGQQDKWVPPGVRFLWGTFLFEGIMESLTEKLEYFSPEGKPLRANLQVSLSSQEIQFKFGEGGAAASAAAGGPSGGGGTGTQAAPGTQPQEPARQGDSVQQMAARSGQQQNWQGIAEANGIENPRQVPPGTLINLNPKR